MKNNRDRLLIGLAVLVVVIAIIVVVGLKSVTTGDKTESSVNVSNDVSIGGESSTNNDMSTKESVEETQKFIDNGTSYSGDATIKETDTSISETTEASTEEISQTEGDSEVLKGGSEYNFPYEPSNVYGDANQAVVNNTNPRFIFGDYIAKDIPVDKQYVKVYLSIDSNLYGESADNQLNEYNKTHKAKYTVECNPGWENAMLRIGIQYPYKLDDANKKMEPIINIGAGENYNGINYQGNSYNIPVSVIYDSIDENGRTGYILAKIPKDLKEFYLRFGDSGVWSFKVKR